MYLSNGLFFGVTEYRIYQARLCKLINSRALHIDPFHVCGNAAKLEDKTKEMLASVKQSYCSVLQFDCIPTDVKGVYNVLQPFVAWNLPPTRLQQPP